MKRSTQAIVFALFLLASQAPAIQAAVVQVDQPTGDVALDRPAVEAAIAQSVPGDTILFAPGTYLIGQAFPSFLEVPVARVTLKGHPDGTTLKGGEDILFPRQFEGLIFTGGEAKVKNLTFEGFSIEAIILGDLLTDPNTDLGGYTVEGCTFKNLIRAITLVGQSNRPTRVRNNTFVNVGIGFNVIGRTMHFTGNTFLNPDPSSVPVFEQPVEMGEIGSFPGSGGGLCENNLIHGNTADGGTDGIFIIAGDPDSVCRRNIISHNTFTNSRVLAPGPLDFLGDFGAMVWLVGQGHPFAGGRVEANLIVGNTLEGTEGLGMILVGATNNLFLRNRIEDVVTDPGVFTDFPGTGILVEDLSNRNLLIRNPISGSSGPAIVLLGNDNLIIADDDEDVLDLGEGNRVIQ